MRRGFALPAVLGALLLIVPVVFSLALRSHQQLGWYQKLEDQARAALLAEEGEAAARLELRNGGTVSAGNRGLSTGGMQWRIDALPYGDDGQRRAFVAGEGIHYGEERLVVGFVEVFTGGPETMLIGSDREWIAPGAGGGSLTDLPALRALHQQAVDRYLTQLVLENGQTPAQFVNRLQQQSFDLDVQHVKDSWPAIAAALGRAKCQVN